MSLVSNIKRLLSDSVIYGLSGVLTRFVSVFLTPIYTRIYSPDDYGVISILTNGYILISIFLVFSLDASAGRWFFDTDDLERRKEVIDTWTWFYFLSSFIAGLFLFFTAEFWQVQFLPETPEAVLYIQMISCSFPMIIWPTIAINVLRFELKAKKSVFLSLIQSFLLIGMNVVFVVLLQFGVLGIYYAQLISAVIILPVSYYLIRSWIKGPTNFNFEIFKGMARFALPFIPASLSYWIINLSGVFFLNHYLPKEEVGLYQIGISIASVAGLATTAFQQAWSPFAFSIINQPNAKRVFAVSLQVYLLVVGMFCTLVSVFALEILKILTTPLYYEATFVASILTFNSLLIGLGSISTLGATIVKKTTSVGLIHLVSSITLVGLNFLFIPRLGKEGAALAIILAQLIIPIYMFYKSQKYYFIPFDFSKNALILGIFVFAVIISYNLPMESIWISIGLKVAVVLISLLIISFLIKKELVLVKSMIINKIKFT